jgi:dTDP-4-amino-4,6-dideoxygalactose transaminase
MKNPYQVVKDFEDSVAEYTRAPYAVAVDSCTNALFLCLQYLRIGNEKMEITIPSRTYPSVPCQIIHAGGKVKFEDKKWDGIYRLKPTNIYDSAKRLTKGMYISKSYMCLSFHGKKHLPIGRGGMILTDSKSAVKWLKMARFDGRHECSLESDCLAMLGWNCYMTPEQASKGLTLLSFLPDKNKDLPWEPYQDLSKYEMYTKANR